MTMSNWPFNNLFLIKPNWPVLIEKWNCCKQGEISSQTNPLTNSQPELSKRWAELRISGRSVLLRPSVKPSAQGARPSVRPDKNTAKTENIRMATTRHTKSGINHPANAGRGEAEKAILAILLTAPPHPLLTARMIAAAAGGTAIRANLARRKTGLGLALDLTPGLGVSSLTGTKQRLLTWRLHSTYCGTVVLRSMLLVEALGQPSQTILSRLSF